MTTAVSQKTIAAALGVSQPAVARHIKRGMPQDSVQSAVEWHHRNVRPQRPRPRQGRRMPRSAIPALPPPPTPTEAASAATAESSLEELAQLRTIARRGLADAQATADDYSLRAWTLAAAKILDQASAAEERLLAVARTKRELLTVGEAREAFGSVLMDVRGLLEAAPGALSAKVNPQDPHHARTILDDWLRAALRTLHRGDNGPDL
jgi:DNA-binding transcriptional regulator LsrR (DeoR family)